MGGGKTYPHILIECYCPEHGLERFKIKIIKRYNIDPKAIIPKYRSRPTYELSGLVIGRNVGKHDILDYLNEYFNQTGMLEKIIQLRLRF